MKLGFKFSIIEAKLNLPEDFKKGFVSIRNSLNPIIHHRILQHTHTQLFYWILVTYNILWMCVGGESHCVKSVQIYWNKDFFGSALKSVPLEIIERFFPPEPTNFSAFTRPKRKFLTLSEVTGKRKKTKRN